MMDLQSALVCVVVFVVSAAVLLLISMFGMKEKSYEEALAEQRQQTSELLGPPTKTKSKEKKQQKKAGKKVKEKQAAAIEQVQNQTAATAVVAASDSKVSASSEPQQQQHHVHHNLHVEFEEPAVIEDPPQPQVVNKKRAKKEKVRPILIHRKDEKPLIVEGLAGTANHFEKIHPKDEFERLHSHSNQKNEVVSKTEAPVLPPKEKPSKKQQNAPEAEPQQKSAKSAKAAKQQQQAQQQLAQQQQAQQQATTTPAMPPVVVEEVHKAEAQKVAAAVVPQSVTPVPSNSVKDKKKKKSEFNTLQQLSAGDRQSVNVSLLMPLVRKADLSRSDIQILIDLLLNKQHEATSFHGEWSEGKADPVQKLKRQLADKEKALTEEQEALAGAQAKLREVRAEQSAERVQLQQRNRGLEEALQSKQLEVQATNTRLHAQQQKMQQMQAQLNEEILAVRKLRDEQNALQMQRQTVEMHLATINDQTQEKEAVISQLRAELQEVQSRNNQLSSELRSYTEQNQASKDHQQSLIAKYDHKVCQLENQALHFKGEAEEADRQKEETRLHAAELERRLSTNMKQESELSMEVARLRAGYQQSAEEIRRFEQAQKIAAEETMNIQQKCDDSERVIVQLRTEMQTLQTEKTQLQAASANGTVAENKAHKLELMNLHNELDSLRSQRQQQIEDLTDELEISKSSLESLQIEVDEQRKSNDDAMRKAILDEQIESRKLLQRIFPDVEVSRNSTQEQWLDSLECAYKKHLNNVKKAAAAADSNEKESNGLEVQKLQSQIAHYKNIIDDTEGILNKLQRNVEDEETRWRTEIEAKEKEIETLKAEFRTNLRIQLSELEEQLIEERKARQTLMDECKALKSCTDLNTVEKLTEEIDRLRETLAEEQSRNKQISTVDITPKTAQLHNLTANGTAVVSEGAAK